MFMISTLGLFGINIAYASSSVDVPVDAQDVIDRENLSELQLARTANVGACDLDTFDWSSIYLPPEAEVESFSQGQGLGVNPDSNGWFKLSPRKGEQTSKYTFYVGSSHSGYLTQTVTLTSGIKYTLHVYSTGCNGAGQQTWRGDLKDADGNLLYMNYGGGVGLWAADASEFASPSHRLTYKANNGTSESDRSSTHPIGEKFTLEDGKVFTAPDGKTFVGWSTSKDGPVEDKYKAGSEFTMGDADVTLYAQWASSGTTIACAPQTGADPAASVWQASALLMGVLSVGLAAVAMRLRRRLGVRMRLN